MQTIDEALAQMRTLHERVFGTPVPEIPAEAFIPFPPGVDPVAYAIEEARHVAELGGRAQATTGSPAPLPSWVPQAFVSVTPEGAHLIVDVPGLDKGDISVTLTGGHLVIRGERRAPTIDAPARVYLSEQPWGRFERAFALPQGIDASKLEARYANGILEIRVTFDGSSASVERRVEVS